MILVTPIHACEARISRNRAIVLVGYAVATSIVAFAQPLYRVTDLGRMPGYTFSTTPLALNNRGEVVGFAQGGALYQAFIWDAPNGMRALPPVPGQETRSSTAVGINELGEIIGFSGQSGGSHMVGWLLRNGQYTLLGTLPGLDGCLPRAINNNTEIVGSATGIDPLDPYTNFYWSPATGMINVAPGIESEFYGINDAGLICGGVRSGDAVGVMTWDVRNGAATDIGSLPGAALSFGYSVNESGRVAGASVYITSAGHRTSHGVWGAAGTSLTDVDLFQSVASGINERGEVVGWRLLLNNSDFLSWVYSPQRGLISDLQSVVEEPAFFSRVSGARAINDRGQIIAYGNNGHFPTDLSRRGLLLTPLFPIPGDVNNDGLVDERDLGELLSVFSTCTGTPGFNPAADFDSSGCIDESDLGLLLANFGM
ncbi:MAG: hypothetical protein U1D55_05415 [Phycisphaerae bacterium]